jgi:hypothetical protein
MEGRVVKDFRRMGLKYVFLAKTQPAILKIYASLRKVFLNLL